MTHRKNSIVLIIGRKGGGKTTRAKELLSRRSHTIALDPMREFPGAIAHDYETAAAYLQQQRTGPRCRLALRSLDTADELALVQLAVFGAPEESLLPGFTICVDETDRLCSPAFLPEPLHRAVNYGRHYGVSLVFVSRRPGGLHSDMRANADEVLIGATQLPRDVDYLADTIGDEAAERARLITRPGHFLRWRLGEPLEELLP